MWQMWKKAKLFYFYKRRCLENCKFGRLAEHDKFLAHLPGMLQGDEMSKIKKDEIMKQKQTHKKVSEKLSSQEGKIKGIHIQQLLTQSCEPDTNFVTHQFTGRAILKFDIEGNDKRVESYVLVKESILKELLASEKETTMPSEAATEIFHGAWIYMNKSVRK